eukprot:Hpha_TRINITY_DN6420_c0_g1::TRINITY_DN6420_c0_g1_i2::g.232::m.232
MFNMSNYNLRGTLPAGLFAALPWLQQVELNNNPCIDGPIPTFENNTRLVFLHAMQPPTPPGGCPGSFTGTVQGLSQNRNLRHIHVSFNRKLGGDISLYLNGNMTNIDNLQMSMTGITGNIPDSFWTICDNTERCTPPSAAAEVDSPLILSEDMKDLKVQETAWSQARAERELSGTPPVPPTTPPPYLRTPEPVYDTPPPVMDGAVRRAQTEDDVPCGCPCWDFQMCACQHSDSGFTCCGDDAPAPGVVCPTQPPHTPTPTAPL